MADVIIINEEAFRATVAAMRNFRPDLRERQIRKILEDILAHPGLEPQAETSQDVWWEYKRQIRGQQPGGSQENAPG